MIRLRQFQPSDIAWSVAAHARHYAASDGFDASFGRLVRQVLEDFAADHDHTCEQGWIATQDGAPIGSIFLVRGDPVIAKLRLFFVEDTLRGTGLGRRLLETATDFATTSGYQQIRVLTHESHRAAGRLYAAQGFLKLASAPAHSFGQDVVVETWEKTLSPA